MVDGTSEETQIQDLIYSLATSPGFQEGERVTERSVTGRRYGDFLIAVFNKWVRRDVGRVFVQIFDAPWLPGWASDWDCASLTRRAVLHW